MAVPLSQAWGVVISEGPHRAGAFGEMTPVSGCKFLSEHQLSAEVINPFWDRFGFYCSSWESSQISVARRSGSSRALAALSLPRGRTEKDAHQGDFHLSPIFPTGFHNRGRENSHMNKTVQERNVLSQRGRDNGGHRWLLSFTACSQLPFGKTMFKGISSLSQPPGQEGSTIGNLTRRIYKPEERGGKNLPRLHLLFLSGTPLKLSTHSPRQNPSAAPHGPSLASSLHEERGPPSSRSFRIANRCCPPAPGGCSACPAASPHGSSAPQGPARAPRNGDFHTSSRSDT